MNTIERPDIEAAKNGDHAAYKRLVEAYQADISRLMWRFTQNMDICEELVQEVFVEAYFSLAGYQFKAPFVFWLKTIATRVGYRLWKRQAKERQVYHLDEGADIAAPASDFGEHDDLVALVHRLLDKLPPADRLVLTLMYFDQCSIKEISKRMGWAGPVVKTRAYRARKRFKQLAENEQIWDLIEWPH